MSYHKILAEPAKTSRGKCKRCKATIPQDTIRIQIVDDRKFNDYIKKNGGRSVFQGEGMYRGYIEAPEGTISIEKYFVHLNCYRPIHPHPFTKEWFKCQKFSARHKADFDHWLEQKASGRSIPAAAREPARKTATKEKKIKKTAKNKRK